MLPEERPAPNRRNRPVFIAGIHRSGTTLLRYLIDAHPRIACPPETKIMPALAAFADYPQTLMALRTLGFAPRDIHSRMRLFAESFLCQYAERRGKERWVEKTPNNCRILPFIDEIFAAEPLYVFLVRHPLDCVHSLQEYFLQSSNHEDPEIADSVRRYGKGRYAWLRYWKEGHEQIHAFAASVGDRGVVIRYEDLVSHPGGVLPHLFAFLGEEMPDDIIARAFRQDHGKGYQDTKIAATTGIHANSIGRWRQWPPAEAISLWDIAAPCAIRFGYARPVDFDTAAST